MTPDGRKKKIKQVFFAHSLIFWLSLVSFLPWNFWVSSISTLRTLLLKSFVHLRINLSSFTKDFRVWETPIENLNYIEHQVNKEIMDEEMSNDTVFNINFINYFLCILFTYQKLFRLFRLFGNIYLRFSYYLKKLYKKLNVKTSIIWKKEGLVVSTYYF